MRRLTTLAMVIAAAALTAAGQFTITTPSLPSATLGQPYPTQVLQTANDPGPITWSVVTGSVPPGSGSAGSPSFVVGPSLIGQPVTTGTFCYGFPASGPPVCAPGSGVQSTPGTYTFTLQATSQSTNQTATQKFTMSVVQPLLITTTTLPNAAANQAYSTQIQTTGGTGQFVWSFIFGAPPPGIVLDPATGILSGTAPNATASYTFTIQVLDQGTQTTVSRGFTINVLGGIAITSATPLSPNAVLNQPYSYQFTADNAAGLVFTLPKGSQLPNQTFSLSQSGLLTGFGLSTGTFTFVVQLTNPDLAADAPPVTFKSFTLYITLGALSIKESTLPNATQNVAYSASLTAVGGLPPYSWSFDVTVPALSINKATGVISGKPPNAGPVAVLVTLKDSIGEVFSQTFLLNVFPAVSITKTSLANGSPGVQYSDTITATGGSIPFSWTVIAGNLPTGLSLNSATGQLSGTPTTQGTFQFTIQVTDSVGGVATKVFTITIGTVQQLTITTTSLPDGTQNQSYSQTVAATGGTQPYAWSVSSGTLPLGLLLNPATGVISGTPTNVGSFTIGVTVTDSLQNVASKSFTFNIASPASSVVITSGDLSGVVSSPFSQTLAATGGTPPYTWSSGTLPSGLQLNAATGVISGTPSAFGTSQVTLTATDTRGQAGSKTIAITIILPAAPATSIGVGTTTQPAVSISIGTPYPVDIGGVLTLTFASSVGSPDGGEARFSDSSRSLPFTVPANKTQAIFSTAPNAAVIPGTVAGTITLTVTSLSAGNQNINPSPAPTKTITIDAAVPVITSVTLQQVTGGINVVVSGYSNTREVSSGSFTFTVSSGNTLSQAQFTVTLTSAYTTWFNNAASNATGGQFKLTVPFSVTGSAIAVTKVTVTLTNGKGASAAASSP